MSGSPEVSPAGLGCSRMGSKDERLNVRHSCMLPITARRRNILQQSRRYAGMELIVVLLHNT
eukprot:scaffold553980_cov38-Prasinocladus_malaysianus.AAC.1